MANRGKVYGLILPKKNQEQTKVKPAQSTFNVFGSESDEDEKSNVQGSLFSKTAGPSKMKRQAQVDIDKALLEDPNVYEYDNIYDEMQASKPKVGAKDNEKSNTEKKPRYIMGLLKAAEQKKKEEDKRKERKVQKEREAEGEMYADKEKFVTSAYKQKMLEMQQEEEKDRREAAFEDLTDVTKQKDMSGFYRYLYRQTAGNEVVSANGDDKTVIKEDGQSSQIKTELDSFPEKRPQQSSGTSSSSESSYDGDNPEPEAAKSKQKAELFRSGRPTAGSNYRKRRVNSSSDSEDHNGGTKVKKASLIQKQQSKSPPRHKQDKDYSRRKSSPTKDNKQRSVSPVSSRKRKDRSRSKERFRTDQKPKEKSRRSRSRKKSRSRSRDEKSRTRSLERSRRSRSREKSRRSRSKDKSMKGQSSTSRNNAERFEHSRSHFVDRKNDTLSRSPSSEDSSGKGRSLITKSKGEGKKLQKSGKTEMQEKDKTVEKRHTNRNDSVTSPSSYSKESTNVIGKNGKVKSTKDLVSGASNEKPAKPISVDPARKVYPHHNSPQSIEEARKRYLQRKATREGAVR